MSSVKGKVRLIGDKGQYAALDDMSFPNPHSERMGELEWQLRYGQDALTRADRMYAASIIDAYREIVILKNTRERQYACSAIKWAGSVTGTKARG